MSVTYASCLYVSLVILMAKTGTHKLRLNIFKHPRLKVKVTSCLVHQYQVKERNCMLYVEGNIMGMLKSGCGWTEELDWIYHILLCRDEVCKMH